MDFIRAGSQHSRVGPASSFTGRVRVDPVYEVREPGRAKMGQVTFEPGARTHWHTHPLGQTLIILSGCGHVQTWGGEIEIVRQGDVVHFHPGEKHWHGATATTGMTHLAISEALNGQTVTWLEPVSDEQYRA